MGWPAAPGRRGVASAVPLCARLCSRASWGLSSQQSWEFGAVSTPFCSQGKSRGEAVHTVLSQSVVSEPMLQATGERPLAQQEGPQCTWSLGQKPSEKGRRSRQRTHTDPRGLRNGNEPPESMAGRLGPRQRQACECALTASGGTLQGLLAVTLAPTPALPLLPGTLCSSFTLPLLCSSTHWALAAGHPLPDRPSTCLSSALSCPDSRTVTWVCLMATTILVPLPCWKQQGACDTRPLSVSPGTIATFARQGNWDWGGKGSVTRHMALRYRVRTQPG